MTTHPRRALVALCMLMMLILCGLQAPKALADTVSYGVTYRDSTVNLRKEATQYSTWLGSYTSGTWMQIVGESGNWYRVNGPDGKSGYMSKNYVSVPEETVCWMGVVSNPKATSFLNLRREPSYDAQVLGIYYNGAPFLLLGYDNGWYHVTLNGLYGYFRKEFVSERSMVGSETVATVVTPNNTGLNLRSGPGLSYASLRQYRGGTYVMVLGKGNDWWKVATVDGYVGFMRSSFLTEGLLEGGSTITPDAGSAYGIVTNPRARQLLNLRESAATTSRVLGQYVNGTRVTILEQGMEWCRVYVDAAELSGYMMTDYLTLHGLPTTPTRTVTHPKRSFVNLRSSPGMAGAVLVRMSHGSTVTVLIPGATWSKVRYNNVTGYAMTAFLE